MISEGVGARTLWAREASAENLQELWGMQEAGEMGPQAQGRPGLLDRHSPLGETSTRTQR